MIQNQKTSVCWSGFLYQMARKQFKSCIIYRYIINKNIKRITFIETESAPASSKIVSTQEREPERPESPPLIPRLPYLPSSRKSLSGTRKTSPSTTKDEQNLSNISQKVSMTKDSVSQIAEDMLSSTKEVIHTVMVYFRC